MAPAHTYEITKVQHGVYAKTLTGGGIDQVTVDARGDDVRPMAEVWTDGTAALYFTTDGSDPVVGDSGTWEIPAGQNVRDGVAVIGGMVKLISVSAVKYSVTVSVGGQ